MLGIAVIIIAVVIVVTVFVVSDVRTVADATTILLLGVSLAVAAVPEGLPPHHSDDPRRPHIRLRFSSNDRGCGRIHYNA